jgi:hypothetical protein
VERPRFWTGAKAARNKQMKKELKTNTVRNFIHDVFA